MKRLLVLLAAVWLMLILAWAAQAAASDLPLAQATVTVQSGDLNGRKTPDPHGQKVAWFQNGDVIDVYEIQGSWARTSGGEAGYCWVSLAYLTTENAGSYTVISNGRLRIRSEPEGDTVGWLKPQQEIDVLGVFGSWARVKEGWVMAEYLMTNK